MYYESSSPPAFEVSIAAKPTAPDADHFDADDAKASLRAALLGQIAAAQFDLEAVISELARDGNSAALVESRSQLGALNALAQQVGGASTASLATLRSEIAAAIASGQMTDAAAHGAGDSPEFQQRWDKLTASTEALRAQLIREGKDVSEFDAHLRDDLRRILKSKGLSDDEIEKRLAAHKDNPLDAVKAYVAEQKGGVSVEEIEKLQAETRLSKEAISASVAVATTIPSMEMVDAMAKLKSAGVMAADNPLFEPDSGVSARTGASRAASRTV